jgi:NADH:ubiquinone oxidoreductase subunit 6 (subunit J)
MDTCVMRYVTTYMYLNIRSKKLLLKSQYFFLHNFLLIILQLLTSLLPKIYTYNYEILDGGMHKIPITCHDVKGVGNRLFTIYHSKSQE